MKNTTLNQKKCCINLYEKYSNSNDLDHNKRFQNHRRNDIKYQILFVFYTLTTKYDHLRRVITFDY